MISCSKNNLKVVIVSKIFNNILIFVENICILNSPVLHSICSAVIVGHHLLHQTSEVNNTKEKRRSSNKNNNNKIQYAAVNISFKFGRLGVQHAVIVVIVTASSD